MTSRMPLIAAAAAFLLAALPAGAATRPIDEVGVSAGGSTWWDAWNSGYSGCDSADPAFTPVGDGIYHSSDLYRDAFDGGLTAVVGFDTFKDADGMGSLNGNTLTVSGPASGLAGALKVRRTETGLPGSPTLRSLLRLKNPQDMPNGFDVLWDSDLGSDDLTAVRASSDGDTVFETSDRWVVSSDNVNSASLSDPPVTHVLYGKGDPKETVGQVVHTLGVGVLSERECMTVELNLNIPPNSTRYLLFFTEMHGSNEDATAATSKFDKKHLTAALLKGISDSVKAKILNWDLT